MVNEDALVGENEVYCNFQSPIGKLIQHLDTLSKKPKIDEKLNGALDSFSQTLSQQDKFLRNGIVKINFAEAGLFFQSCSVLFGKSVDLLWDQALELHARLIKYDYENAIQKGKKINQDVIEKLEERKNKYKRKKNFKLIVTEKENNNDILLFDKPIETLNTEDDEEAFESINISSAWNYVKHCYEEIAKIPRAVFVQQRKMYRIDNYDILDGVDADIYDLDDGEFNTKYSRMPAWHHIEHLFEYNREGLLPDKNNLIARLRLAVYEEIWFLRDNKIPLNTPFKDYEERYKVFKQQFFEKEALKWQNMPLDTLADLRRQMEYLAQHGCDEIADSSLDQDDCVHSSSSVTVNSTLNQDIPSQNGSGDAADSRLDQNITAQSETGKAGDLNQGICAQTEGPETSDACSHQDIPGATSDNSHITLESTCNQAGLERTFSNNSSSGLLGESLTINIEKLPAAVVSRKLRPDSGFCDVKSETRSLFDPVDSVSPPDISLMDSGFLSSASLDTSANLSSHNQTGLDHTLDVNQIDPTDNHEIAQVTSNQSLTQSSTTLESNGDSLTTSRNITIIEEMTPLKCGRKVLKQKPKMINEIEKESGPPNKRCKLSKKQLEKLINSLVPPVGEDKFEEFFAMNYQPDVGEGEIDQIVYDGCDSVDAMLCDEEGISDVHADQSGNSDAIISDTGSLKTVQDNRQESVEKNITEITTPGVNTSDILSPLTGEIVMITSNENSASNEVGQAPDEVRGNEDGNNTESEAADQDNRQEPVLENNLPRITMQEANRSNNSLSNTDQQSTTSEDELFQKLLTSLRESRDGNSSISEAVAQEKQKQMEQEKESSRKRVEEWRTLITPILSNLKEKDFDIHEYGSKIMENMEINEKRFFKHIVYGKTSVEVVRYFISSLQLANTGNIEIYGAIEGKQSNETFGIRLLKTDRYHEHLTNYHAPSEQTFQECIQQLRRNQSKSKNEIYNNDSQNERMKNGPKSKKAKLSPRQSETKVQQHLANRKEHGVTLRWVGSTNIPDPQPTTSYADHHSDYVQASLPLPSDLTIDSSQSYLPNSSCAFLDTKLQKIATMKQLSKSKQNLLDLHSQKSEARKPYKNSAERVNVNGLCLQSTAPCSIDLVYGHKNSVDCDSNHPHAEVQYSEASGTFINNMFDGSQLDGCSDDYRVQTGIISIDNTNSTTTNFKDYSSSMHIDFRAARELSPAPLSEMIFLNNLESVQRTKLGYPMFSSPK